MKRMDFPLYLIPVFLIVGGTILTAFLANKDQKKLESNQETIKELNDVISNNVELIKSANNELSKIAAKTESLVVDIDLAQEELKKTAQETNDATKNNLAVSMELGKLVNSSKTLIKSLSDMQTGGEGYLKFGLMVYKERLSLWYMVVGDFPLRNLNIQIHNAENQMDKVEISSLEEYEDFIVSKKENTLKLKIDYLPSSIIKKSALVTFASFDKKIFKKDASFSINIQSLNKETSQTIQLSNVPEVNEKNFHYNLKSSIFDVASWKVIDSEPLLTPSKE